MNTTDDSIARKLQPWERDFHKALLTPLILLALKNGPKDMTFINFFIDEVTEFKIRFNDASIYRTLSRLQKAGMIESKLHNQTWRSPSPLVPPIPKAKIYTLSQVGAAQLDHFLRSNHDLLQSIIKTWKILGANDGN